MELNRVTLNSLEKISSMSNRSDDLLVLDIIESIEAIFSYTKGVTEEAFIANREKSDAVIRNIEVIGEAAGNLSLTFQEQHSEIPWHQIIGMRNRLIHGYFGISLKIIWQVVTVDLPVLHQQIAALR
jgi:uncharacterized protein with HEPN domain